MQIPSGPHAGTDGRCTASSMPRRPKCDVGAITSSRRPRSPAGAPEPVRFRWASRVHIVVRGGSNVADSRPQTIAYPALGSRPHRRDLEPLAPHVIVLFGATGDLAKRKLIPG